MILSWGVALLKKGYWNGWIDSMTLLAVLFWHRLKEQLVKQLELPFVKVGGNALLVEITNPRK